MMNGNVDKSHSTENEAKMCHNKGFKVNKT